MRRYIIVYRQEGCRAFVEFLQEEGQHSLVVQPERMPGQSIVIRNILSAEVSIDAQPVATFGESEVVIVVSDDEGGMVTFLLQGKPDAGMRDKGEAGMI